MQDKTKQRFADTMIELAKKKSVRNIQVKELCEACGMERTTFYYHFKDKYDLVAWIYSRQYYDEEKKSSYPNDEEMICRMLYRMKEQRAFFLNALQDPSQNSLRQYMLDFYITSERAILMKYRKTNTLDDETEYALRQYSYGCMGHTIDWLLGRSSLSAEQMAHFQYEYMPNALKEAFSQETPASGSH